MFLRKYILLLLVVSIAGCSNLGQKLAFLKEKPQSYQNDTAGSTLQLPPDLIQAQVGDSFYVPSVVSQETTQQPVSLLPPGSLADQIATGKTTLAASQQQQAQMAAEQPTAQHKETESKVAKKPWWRRWW